MIAKSSLKNLSILFLTAVHLIFLSLLLLAPPAFLRKKKQRSLTVHTIHKHPPQKTVPTTLSTSRPTPQKIPIKTSAPVPAPVVKKTQPTTTPAPTVKKEAAIQDKVIAKTPPKASPKAAIQSPPAPRAKISDALLKELEMTLAQMDQKVDKKSEVKLPSMQPLRLQIDTGGAPEYRDQLIQTLHENLRLPEFGEVKIELTLHRDGSVATLKVLETKSEKNKRYLESQLKTLRFPKFPEEKNETTFIVNFSNA